MADEKNVRFEIAVAPEIETGVYANFMSVWHSPHDFTLDFAVTQQASTTDDGVVVVPTQVVARIKFR